MSKRQRESNNKECHARATLSKLKYRPPETGSREIYPLGNFEFFYFHFESINVVKDGIFYSVEPSPAEKARLFYSLQSKKDFS